MIRHFRLLALLLFVLSTLVVTALAQGNRLEHSEQIIPISPVQMMPGGEWQQLEVELVQRDQPDALEKLPQART